MYWVTFIFHTVTHIYEQEFPVIVPNNKHDNEIIDNTFFCMMRFIWLS